MTGEHFSSATGKELEKSKDAYVRFRWETKKGGKRPKQTILEREKIKESKILDAFLNSHFTDDPSKCICCHESKRWPLLMFEFYNWEKKATERELFAHIGCLEKVRMGQLFEGLRLIGKNPILQIELNCLSADKCGFFEKSSDFRNCQHIVLRFDSIHEDNHDGTVFVHMAPLLFCKRAHPGEFFLEAEEETWYNVEDVGLALMGKRLTESLNIPQIREQIEAYKKQNPHIITEIKRLLAENPGIFTLISPQATFLAQLMATQTPEESWEIIREGNDYY